MKQYMGLLVDFLKLAIFTLQGYNADILRTIITWAIMICIASERCN